MRICNQTKCGFVRVGFVFHAFYRKRIKARQVKNPRNPPFFIFVFVVVFFHIVFLFVVNRLFVFIIVFFSVCIW